MMKRPVEVNEEIAELTALLDNPHDEAFISGVIRGLEWVTGKSGLPSNLIRVCRKGETVH